MEPRSPQFQEELGRIEELTAARQVALSYELSTNNYLRSCFPGFLIRFFGV
jgi:hypothetical protein